MPCHLDSEITQSMSLKMLSTSSYLLELLTPTQQKLKSRNVVYSEPCGMLKAFDRIQSRGYFMNIHFNANQQMVPLYSYEPASVYTELISG